MFVDESKGPEDFPAPATLDEVTAGFPGALYTFAPQAALEEWTVATLSGSTDGHVTLQAASIGYTLWRNPDDHADPANLADLSDDLRAALDAPPIRPLPDWMTAITARMRYPGLWEAVRTTVAHSPAERSLHTAEFLLTEHVNHLLMNRFRDERVRGAMPGELLGRATETCVEHDVPILVDGREVPGIRIDTDAHVLGVGAQIGDRCLTVVVERDHLPHVDLAFATRRVL